MSSMRVAEARQGTADVWHEGHTKFRSLHHADSPTLHRLRARTRDVLCFFTEYLDSQFRAFRAEDCESAAEHLCAGSLRTREGEAMGSDPLKQSVRLSRHASPISIVSRDARRNAVTPKRRWRDPRASAVRVGGDGKGASDRGASGGESYAPCANELSFRLR